MSQSHKRRRNDYPTPNNNQFFLPFSPYGSSNPDNSNDPDSVSSVASWTANNEDLPQYFTSKDGNWSLIGFLKRKRPQSIDKSSISWEDEYRVYQTAIGQQSSISLQQRDELLENFNVSKFNVHLLFLICKSY